MFMLSRIAHAPYSEQCMLTALIVANIKMPDPRVGNQVVLAGA